MSSQTPTPPERLFDLLADRALQGLSATEGSELNELLRQWPAVDPLALDRAAASASLAFAARQMETMPASAASSLEAAGRTALAATPAPEPIRRSRRRSVVTWSGWMVAAACLVIAFGPMLVERVERRHDTIPAVSWQISVPNVKGDLLWDTRRQKGVLRISGLPANDPQTNQYQIWISDPATGDAPVDAGVFDVPTAGDEVTVYFQPPRPVPGARVFSVTLEKAGGVAVSRQQRLAVATLDR